ncbi:hypothetical protein Tco_1232848, partial [Tanacetum coccineum]
NIDPTNGLCNDTRLICKRFDPNVINAEIDVRQHGGVGVLLPIISLTPSEEDMFPFKLKGLSRKTTKGISEGFDDLINSELSISSTLSSHEKLRNLKPKIRLWHNLLWNNDISRKQDAIKFLKILEDKIDAGNASTEDRDTRINIIQEIEKFDNLEAMDSIQKAHIKWDVEGDENSKYFHSLTKQKRRSNSINGIHYKIVAKVLANRLSKVVDKIVSQEQTAFIANRQILDGPLILSEVIDCPTFEFNIKRGLRQGDPLSPFLFIIIMEGLHLSILDSVRNGLFRGINIDSSGVSHEEVQLMASNTGCKAGKFPFSYLGLPIGFNMSLTANWSFLIEKIHSKLSSWNANLLSFGGRLTLLKVVLGSLGIYFLSLFKAPSTVLKTLENIRASFFWGGSLTLKKMSWLKWPHVLSSFDKGGLAIGSLKAFNHALLQKWRCRFFVNPDSLWVKVIRALHGREGGFDHIMAFSQLPLYLDQIDPAKAIF